MAQVKANYIVEILTPTPRRVTSYRGRSTNGQRGLVVDGLFYQAAIVEFPGISEGDSVAPLRLPLSLGNAENLYTDLFSDPANQLAPITIRKLTFTGATWDEAFQPSFTSSLWFEGETGTPILRGERVVIDCHASMGRRGKSPRTKSRQVMVNHQPLSANHKIVVKVRT